ncbi:Uncharacterized protein TCM_024917 [Theobroma cacao]|uniref:RNase H type-1 domain-containing protein n=1 Tax=Theobroma cacao TaxID=3641 RepID=A0A061EWM1_THECC|nr:Uncharacterized protein TCM_024917 [Theobroma cacao]
MMGRGVWGNIFSLSQTLEATGYITIMFSSGSRKEKSTGSITHEGTTPKSTQASREWSLYFDGSSNNFRGGAEIVPIPPGRKDNSLIQSSELTVSHLSRSHISLEEKGLCVLEVSSKDGKSLISGLELNTLELGKEPISLAFKLDFPCTNNQAEYEALVLGLYAIATIEVNNLCIHQDSNLIVKQTNGEFSLKELMLASYRTLV